MPSLNIVVIGAGMYVCGKGTAGYGTIMPAIFEWKKRADVGKVYVAGASREGASLAKGKMNELRKKIGVDIDLTYFPKGAIRDTRCYLDAIGEIPKPACAIIAVPDNLHSDIASAAIEGGLHTLVVKPLAPTLSEVRKLIKLQKEKEVYCAVEFHKRLDYANIKLKDAINQGQIGDPLYFIVEYSQRKSVPSEHFKKWVKRTNVFQYLGIHYVDVIYFATNAAPVRVMAIGQIGWLASRGIDAYDSIQTIVEWKAPSGKTFTSHISTHWVDPLDTSSMSDQKIKVIGTKGRFESDQKKRGITVVTDERGIEEPNPYFCCAYGDDGGVSYRGYGVDSIHQFLNDVSQIEKGVLKIEDLEDKRPTFKQSIVPTAVLEAVNRSLKDCGKWVDVRGL